MGKLSEKQHWNVLIRAANKRKAYLFDEKKLLLLEACKKPLRRCYTGDGYCFRDLCGNCDH